MKKLLLNVAMLFVSAQAFAEVKEGEYLMLNDQWSDKMPGCEIASIMNIQHTDVAGKITVDVKDQIVGMCTMVTDPNPRSYELTLESSDCFEHYKGPGLELKVLSDLCFTFLPTPYITSFETGRNGGMIVKYSNYR